MTNPPASAHNDEQIEPSDPNGQNVVAIDGPAASGKTTVAVRLADRLGAVFLDTGLLYRAVTLLAQRSGLTEHDETRLSTLVDGGAIAVHPPSVADGRYCDVLLNGEDVTGLLRDPDIDARVSAISALPMIRAALLPIQRSFARERRVVMVGRDIASVVFPNAAVKVYLDASLAERARRRWAELVQIHQDLTLAEVEEDLRQRDRVDSSRKTAPLQIARGATFVKTDGKSIADVVDEVAAIAERAWNAT